MLQTLVSRPFTDSLFIVTVTCVSNETFYSLPLFNTLSTDDCVDNDPNVNCTPISGFMTAYLGPGSDEEASKAAMLYRIQQGMESGAYLDSEITKTSFIGVSRAANRDNNISAVGLGRQDNGKESSMVIGISVFCLGFAALIGFGVLHMREKKKRNIPIGSSSARGPSAQSSRLDAGGMEIAVRRNSQQVDNSLDIDKHSNNMANSTLSSSGDEEDLKYGVTEDYADLAGTFTNQNITPVYPEESCLAVINSSDNMDDMGSFETGTPLSPAASTEANSVELSSPPPAGMLSPTTPDFIVPRVDSDISFSPGLNQNGDEELPKVALNPNEKLY